MAIDTRLKRASTMSALNVFMVSGRAPDNSIDAADRSAIAYAYAGFAAGGTGAGDIAGNPMIVHIGFMMTR